MRQSLNLLESSVMRASTVHREVLRRNNATSGSTATSMESVTCRLETVIQVTSALLVAILKLRITALQAATVNLDPLRLRRAMQVHTPTLQTQLTLTHAVTVTKGSTATKLDKLVSLVKNALKDITARQALKHRKINHAMRDTTAQRIPPYNSSATMANSRISVFKVLAWTVQRASTATIQ